MSLDAVDDDADVAAAATRVYINNVQQIFVSRQLTRTIHQNTFINSCNSWSPYDITKNGVLCLDTASEVSVFRDDNLFSRIFTSWRPVILNGVTEGGKLVVDEGLTEFGQVYYCKDVPANIVAFSLVYDKFSIIFDDGAFIVPVSPEKQWIFRRHHGSHLYTTHIDRWTTPPSEPICLSTVVTVDQRLSEFSQREQLGARRARELSRKLFHPGDGRLSDMLRLGKIRGAGCTPQDLWRANYIWGQPTAVLKGKTTNRQPKRALPDEIRPLVPVNQSLDVDILFVNNVAYFISVMSATEYVQVTPIDGKSIESIYHALTAQIRFAKRRGITVPTVFCDGEAAVHTEEFKERLLKDQDTTVEPVEIDPKVERKIRTVKERVRGTINSLPFALTAKLEMWLVIAVTFAINLIPTKNANGLISPREKLFGYAIDVNTELKHGFGDYVQVFEKSDNSTDPRTRGAIALTPTGSTDGTWWYMPLDTLGPHGKAVRRSRATSLPMPVEVIARLEREADKRPSKRKSKIEL